MKNVLNNIVDWFKEYDDEITWFLIGSLFADGMNELNRNVPNVPFGLFMLFISAVLWIIYMKELKENK